MRIRLQIVTPTEVLPWEHTAQRLTIGRSPECDLSFRGPAGEVVSERHALIELSASGAVLADLGSTNGTYLNGVPLIRPTEIKVGDWISLGHAGPRLDVLLIDLAAPGPAGGNVTMVEDLQNLRSKQPPDCQWHYAKANSQQRFGPVTLAELRQLAAAGKLGPSDLVWRPGLASWTAAGLVEELAMPAAASGVAFDTPMVAAPAARMPAEIGPSSQPYVPASPLQDDRYAQPSSDPPGVISLICGILALVSIVVGCLSCGIGGFVTYPLAVLFAVAGLIAGFFARGNLRVAGILLSALALIPAVILLVMLFSALGVAGAARSL